MPTVQLTHVASFAVLVVPHHQDGDGDPHYKYRFASRLRLVDAEPEKPVLRLLSAACGCSQWHENINGAWFSCRELLKCDQHAGYENFNYFVEKKVPTIVFGVSAEDVDEQRSKNDADNQDIMPFEEEIKQVRPNKSGGTKGHVYNLKDIVFEKLIALLPTKTKFHSPSSTGKRDKKSREVYALRYKLNLPGDQYIYIRSTSYQKLHELSHKIVQYLRAEQNEDT
jgi:hypothetical protein